MQVDFPTFACASPARLSSWRAALRLGQLSHAASNNDALEGVDEAIAYWMLVQLTHLGAALRSAAPLRHLQATLQQHAASLKHAAILAQA